LFIYELTKSVIVQSGGKMPVSTKEVLTDYSRSLHETRDERLIEAINNCETRDEAVQIYTDAMSMQNVDWSKVNNSIIDKWSLSGLKYIKNMHGDE
jgi:hypothetical protein